MDEKTSLKFKLADLEKLLLYACWLDYAELVDHIIRVRPELELNKKAQWLKLFRINRD